MVTHGGDKKKNLKVSTDLSSLLQIALFLQHQVLHIETEFIQQEQPDLVDLNIFRQEKKVEEKISAK